MFDSLPADLKEAILSVETAEKMALLRDKHSLMLDQAGELGDELGLLMIGLTKQKDFVVNITKRLGIPTEKAVQISVDINKEILNPVRASLQKIQEEKDVRAEVQEHISKVLGTPPPSVPRPPVTPIEKAGNFDLHRPAPSASPQYNDHTLTKEDVLSDLENIKNLKPENAENFVEHLLSNPVTNIPQTEVKKAEPAPPPQKKYGADPYREQI